MNRRIDGEHLTKPLELFADVVIVGSGPAGSVAAREASRAGASVIVLEAGKWFEPTDFAISAFRSMAQTYRSMGASVVVGSSPAPYVQGKMVGGSSPINGAICWRLPEDVYKQWITKDEALATTLSWQTINTITDSLEARLQIKPTDPAIAGVKNQLMAVGANALGLENRPIRRNVSACEGLGRCVQGCPSGRKLSVERTLLADAEERGCVVVSSVQVKKITTHRGRATGVIGRSVSGQVVTVRADLAVIVAASAVQSPALLMSSGLHQGPVGQHFQCHPGVSVAGRFPQVIRMWQGATQGHEVIGLRKEGLKFETLGFGLAIIASRMPGVGAALSEEILDMAHVLDWGAAVRAQAEGRVRLLGGQPIVSFQPTPTDVYKFRRGVRVLGEMMLEAGADYVMPGIKGVVSKTSKLSDLIELEKNGPTSVSAFQYAITHMFGTCRMGSDPATSVVGPDFRHHHIEGLYVADSSVFPSNIGVNPQVPIMALATLATRHALRPTGPF